MTLVAMESQGRDILWNNARANGYVKFQNKVWQAFRFSMMHFEDYDPAAERTLSPYDHWVLARTGEAVRRVRGALDNYKFNEAASELYAFTWDELCDWYLEFSKGTLYSEDAPEAAKQGARHTLWTVFQSLARLMHPITPFISEEIWQQLPGTEGSVMAAAYPKVEEYPIDPEALSMVATTQGIITAIRRIRADMEISPRTPIRLRTQDTTVLEAHSDALRDLAGVHGFDAGDGSGPASTFVVEGRSYFVPLEGVVDLDAERSRLDKVLAKVDKDLGFLAGKLGNKGFTDRAPAHVVAEIQEKHDTAKGRRVRLAEARAGLNE
jgi:valyl-tRNA synthetase